MEESLLVQQPKSAVHLVARDPVEMKAAQADLADWLKQKIDSFDPEITSLNASINEAKTNGWNYASLTRQRNKEVARQEFYAKVLAAVEAGFTIIPEFPIDLFAIRVSREYPQNDRTTVTASSYGPAPVFREKPDVLPPGEGEYVSPWPQVQRGTYEEQKGEQLVKYKYAEPTEFAEVVFPIRAARPDVMSAAAAAMALRVFDQIGICPVQRKPDPLIIGQILGKKEGYQQKSVNFLIVWHLSLNEL